MKNPNRKTVWSHEKLGAVGSGRFGQEKHIADRRATRYFYWNDAREIAGKAIQP